MRATDDVLNQLPKIWEKREEVQRKRIVKDEQIFPLFRQPLYVSSTQPGYGQKQKTLFEAFGIDQLFQNQSVPDRREKIAPPNGIEKIF